MKFEAQFPKTSDGYRRLRRFNKSKRLQTLQYGAGFITHGGGAR